MWVTHDLKEVIITSFRPMGGDRYSASVGSLRAALYLKLAQRTGSLNLVSLMMETEQVSETLAFSPLLMRLWPDSNLLNLCVLQLRG
jgi:hypothetical protein